MRWIGFLAPQPGELGVRVAHIARHDVVERPEILEIVEKLLRHSYSAVGSSSSAG